MIRRLCEAAVDAAREAAFLVILLVVLMMFKFCGLDLDE